MRQKNERSLPGEVTRKVILRRVAFLLNEANCKDRFRDQTVTYAMRVVSNWCTFRRDIGSGHKKLKNRRMSRKANELFQTLDLKSNKDDQRKWRSSTINEHQKPLAQIWNLICANPAISSDQILSEFEKWLTVTVTKEENDSLRKYKDAPPIKRYRLARIEVGELDDNSHWKPLPQDIPVDLDER